MIDDKFRFICPTCGYHASLKIPEVKVVEYWDSVKCTCPHCGAELEFDSEDFE